MSWLCVVNDDRSPLLRLVFCRPFPPLFPLPFLLPPLPPLPFSPLLLLMAFPFLRPLCPSPSPVAFLFFPFVLLLLLRLIVFASHISTKRSSLPEYPIISCYSCASEEYEQLFRRSSNVLLFGQPHLFDRLCDSKLDLISLGSTIPCDGNCVSVLEPQYFGGIQNERKPFTFVRGCSTDVFATVSASTSSEEVPTEVEYIQREHFCMDLAIGQIWPELGTPNSKETVRVCSCATNGCNTHETEADMANGVDTDGRRWRNGGVLMALAIGTAFSNAALLSSFLNIKNT